MNVTSVLSSKKTVSRWVIVGGIVVLGLLLILSASLLKGRLGLWRLANVGRAILDSRSVSGYSRGEFTNVIFLHHSTGGLLIEQGGVRDKFSAAGFSFWDHGYDWEKLRGPDGVRKKYSYSIPNDNTDPDGLAGTFAQPAYGLPWNAFSGLLQHEVIAFKSCFPVSNISSDQQLSGYKSYYLSMRNVMDRHPDKLFVVVTQPPLNPVETDAQAATRARAFANWLKSDEYLSGHSNVVTFDLFGYLAEDNPALPDYNMLRAAFREGTDSHPNQIANQKIGPLFADFIISAAKSYSASAIPKR